jgi:peptide/nickel transport system permease protein
MSAGQFQIAATLPETTEDGVERMWSRGQRVRSRFQRTPSLFIGGGIVLFLIAVAVLAPLVAPAGPNHAFDDGLNAFGQPRPPFTGHFLLGSDSQERDVLSRLIYGARISLFVAVVANALSMTVSILVGLVAGYLRGAAETVLMRLTDLMMSLPSLLLAMALIVVFQPGLFMVIVAIALVNWTYLARVVYGEVVSLRERQFVESARAVGTGQLRIMRRHILPHLRNLSITYFALNSSQIILTEAALSFLGVGVQPPTPSWGNMIADAQQAYLTAPWLLFLPSLCIILTVVGFNLLGSGLQAILET